jgi:adenosylhomocysteine nucleosidase
MNQAVEAAVPQIGVVTGLVAEGSIAQAFSRNVVSGGGRADHTEAWIKHLIRNGVTGLVSFGIAGGLSPDVKPGTVIIGSDVWSRQEIIPAYRPWVEHLSRVIEGSVVGRIAGQDKIAASLEDKQALSMASHALSIDMESHVVARLAAMYELPFAVIRAISDGATRSLPHAAQVGMLPSGNIAAVAS